MNYLTAAALADTVDDLFVGKYHLTGGTPVDRHLLFVCQSLFVQLQENPLGPFVVIGIGGVDFAVPVKGDAQRLELLLKACHVIFGDNLGMDMVFDCKVLGGQTECVPAHRVQDVVALQTALSGNDVQCGVGTRMSYMESLTGRIRELDQRIVFGFCVVVGGSKGVLVVPALLPFRLDTAKIVLQLLFLHSFC